MKLMVLFFVLLVGVLGVSFAHAEGPYQIGDCVWGYGESPLVPSWKKYRVIGLYKGLSGQQGVLMQRTGIMGLFSDPINRLSCEVIKVSENKSSEKAAKDIELASLDNKAQGQTILIHDPKTGKTATALVQGAE